MSDETWDDTEDFGPEEAERRINEFVAAANDLPGPAMSELAGRVIEVIRAASAEPESLLAGVPHNNVPATQLLLSQRARHLTADDADQWHLFAASTLLSGRIVMPPA
jgi:hypothetical protein